MDIQYQNIENFLNSLYDTYKNVIIWNDLIFIKPNIPFYEQKWELKEDLFQMNCTKDISIDIGWYWDSEDYLFDDSVKGIFRIRVIQLTILMKCNKYL